jgi:hypothetical protein
VPKAYSPECVEGEFSEGRQLVSEPLTPPSAYKLMVVSKVCDTLSSSRFRGLSLRTFDQGDGFIEVQVNY